MATAKVTAKKTTTTTTSGGGGFLGGIEQSIVGGASAITNPLGTKKSPSPLGSAVTATGNVVGGAASATESVGTFLGKLGELSTWIRVAEVLGGAILLIMGLRQLASVASGSQGVKGVPVPNMVPVPV